MQVIQIKIIEFEDLLDGVNKLEKRLDKIGEKLSGSRIKYVPLKEVLKILNIQRKTADNWHKSGILKKKYVWGIVFYSLSDIEKVMEEIDYNTKLRRLVIDWSKFH